MLSTSGDAPAWGVLGSGAGLAVWASIGRAQNRTATEVHALRQMLWEQQHPATPEAPGTPATDAGQRGVHNRDS